MSNRRSRADDAAAREKPPARLRRTIFWVAVTGVSLYLVAPSVFEVLSSWSDVEKLAPGWLAVMFVAQAAAMASLWALQRLAIKTEGWHPIVTSQLAGKRSRKGRARRRRDRCGASVPHARRDGPPATRRSCPA